MTIDLEILRKQIKKKLQNITPKSRAISSKNIATKIINSEIFIHSQNIACYIPIENEVDTQLIIETIWQQGKNCYLPTLPPNTKKHLCFVKFAPNDKLSKINKIFEPSVIPIANKFPRYFNCRTNTLGKMNLGAKPSSERPDPVWKHNGARFTPSVNEERKELKQQSLPRCASKRGINSFYKGYAPEKIISPTNLDLVIAPLIGFNNKRFRLGRGAGCYDTTFEFKRYIKNPSKPYLLGIGHKCQYVEFDPNPWDVVMDEIITA